MEKLYAGLETAGFRAWVDWEDIPKGEHFLNEIYAGIEGAHTFILILTPAALKSEVCNQEIAHARQHNKRIIPVLHQEVMADGNVLDEILQAWGEQPLAQENWEVLRYRNWLFFQEDSRFDDSLHELLAVIQTDITHVKFHRRITVRAVEWNHHAQKAEFLLRGDDLETAHAWLQLNASNDPQPTDLHQAYIAASILDRDQRAAADHKRQRNLNQARVGLVGAIIAVLGLFIIFLQVQARTEQENAATLEAQIQTSDANARDAVNNAATAFARGTDVALQATVSYENLIQSQQIQALFLADLAQQELAGGNIHNALGLATESVQARADGYINQQSRQVLLEATSRAVPYQVLTVNGNRAVRWGEGAVFIWTLRNEILRYDLNSGDLLPTSQELIDSEETQETTTPLDDYAMLDFDGDAPVNASLSPDGRYLITGQFSGAVRLWDFSSATPHIKTQWGENAAWVDGQAMVLGWNLVEPNTIAQVNLASKTVVWSTVLEKDRVQTWWRQQSNQVMTWHHTPGGSPELSLFTLPKDTPDWTLSLQTEGRITAHWHPTLPYFVAFAEEQLWVVDAQTGAFVLQHRATAPILVAAWHPQQAALAISVEAGSPDQQLYLLTVSDERTPILKGGQNSASLLVLAWSPNGEWLLGAAGHLRPDTQLWQAGSWNTSTTLLPATFNAAVAWHPNSKMILIPNNGKLNFYDVESARYLEAIETDLMLISALGWSPDGKHFYAVDESTNGQWAIYVWDAASHALLWIVPYGEHDRFQGYMQAVHWADAPTRILIEPRVDGVQVWTLDVGSLLTFAQTILPDGLANDTRAEFFLPTQTYTPAAR